MLKIIDKRGEKVKQVVHWRGLPMGTVFVGKVAAYSREGDGCYLRTFQGLVALGACNRTWSDDGSWDDSVTEYQEVNATLTLED